MRARTLAAAALVLTVTACGGHVGPEARRLRRALALRRRPRPVTHRYFGINRPTQPLNGRMIAETG